MEPHLPDDTGPCTCQLIGLDTLTALACAGGALMNLSRFRNISTKFAFMDAFFVVARLNRCPTRLDLYVHDLEVPLLLPEAPPPCHPLATDISCEQRTEPIDMSSTVNLLH